VDKLNKIITIIFLVLCISMFLFLLWATIKNGIPDIIDDGYEVLILYLYLWIQSILGVAVGIEYLKK